jgi:hypothetical protein
MGSPPEVVKCPRGEVGIWGGGLQRPTVGVEQTSPPWRALAACGGAAPLDPLRSARLPYQLARWSNSYSGTGVGAVGEESARRTAWGRLRHFPPARGVRTVQKMLTG